MTSDRPRPRSARISPDLLAFLGYFALTAAFYSPLLLGLHSFPPGDFTDHFLPFSLFQRAELLAGRLPLWNPYTFSGHPFLADVQAAVFYPLSNLVLALTLPWSDPRRGSTGSRSRPRSMLRWPAASPICWCVI